MKSYVTKSVEFRNVDQKRPFIASERFLRQVEGRVIGFEQVLRGCENLYFAYVGLVTGSEGLDVRSLLTRDWMHLCIIDTIDCQCYSFDNILG